MFTGAAARSSAGGAAAGRGSPAAAPDLRGIVQFLAQAWLAYLGSGLRYWSQLADAWARTAPALLRTLADGDTSAKHPEARAVALDELRGRLRELADIPSQESRLLQAELDRIAAGLWPKADTKPNGPYWRRWEAKP
jgi:hypothetical protein